MEANPSRSATDASVPGKQACHNGSQGYDSLREKLIWNTRLAKSRSPDLIVQARSARDVAAWINWARTHGLKVALRGSGHNYQAAALQDSGVMIDLSGLDQIEIDVDARRARVGAGVTGGRLIKALAGHGLAFPIGHCADVALSGFILSGGIGWNYGQWGAACANVAAMEVVTAQGDIICIDADNEPDLFWAAKGAGPAFFAAVTSYDLILHTEPESVVSVNMVFRASSATIVAHWLEEAGEAADPTVEIICMIGPDPESGEPSVTVRGIASGSDIRQAHAKLGALRMAPPDAELLAPITEKVMTFAELPQLSAMPSGKRAAVDQIWSEASPAELLLAVQHLAGIPEKSSAISITGLGGRTTIPGMPDRTQGALSRGGVTSAGIYAMWDSAEDDERHLEWVAAADAALARFKTGRYVAEADLFAAPDRLDDCFASQALERLRALQKHYDPKERFFSCL